MFQCSGDVVVTAINDLVLDDIENRYWRHSLNQEINVDIHINQAEFQYVKFFYVILCTAKLEHLFFR